MKNTLSQDGGVLLLKKFSKNLTAIEYPKEKTSWNIAGIIKGQNAFYKFDVRDMLNSLTEHQHKKGEQIVKQIKWF